MTSPAPSLPDTNGSPTGEGYMPLRKYVSMKLTPEAWFLTLICPGPGAGTEMSS